MKKMKKMKEQKEKKRPRNKNYYFILVITFKNPFT